MEYSGDNKMVLKPIRISKKLDENGGEEEAILLSPPSQMFHEPNYNVCIVAIMGWKVPIEVDAIKAEIKHKMLKHPRFSSLQVMDESDGSREIRLVPTAVNIDDHVIVPQIAGINMDTDKFVEDYLSNLSTTTIDMSKPLWDLHILNVKTSDAEATSIFRFHHSLGDGVSLISLLLSLFRTSSDPTSLPTLPVSSSSKDKSNLSINNRENIWSLIWKYLVKLWLLIKLLFNTVVDILLLTATMLFLKDSQSPFTVAQGFKSNRHRFIYRTVSLNDIKFVKNATNATVNDFILGITQAALSRYIHRRYEVEGKRKFSLERMRCRATVLMNLRPALGVQGATTLSERILSRTTLIFSNVIGPLEEVSWSGHPLTFVAPTCYGHPTGLMVHACSYAEKLTFVIAAEEGTIPDPNQLGDDFVDSFMLIVEAALSNKIENQS
ncbi:wax ester synthase/diacylglycerol acyltransferase 5-like isoform X2 [Lycium ferocissimum]|uniref:wax ester synthase/diacylglycerol acyltransferase 5-like isoform X2 n=1 Tax=Lycium ferocissimum TaxID=112874 RepID=UPI0028162AAC|nr:wax ester synthase/diacylglycerol acyltransferase 5-like isoform X2 [Lycium ferocissimum]